MQRLAFNEALHEAAYDIEWGKEAYVSSLVYTGGQERLAAFMSSHAISVEKDQIERIHERKTALFNQRLHEEKLHARPGVIHLLKDAKAQGIKTAFVTTTNRATVDAIIESTVDMTKDLFDFVLSSDENEAYGLGKPSGDPYKYVMQKLGVTNPIALEDTQISLQSPINAGIPCVAMPNENSLTHDFSKALVVLTELGEGTSVAKLMSMCKLWTGKNMNSFAETSDYIVSRTRRGQ
mmetsp:Transcript_41589/g.109706  ORF Transcript_41589/g.109706 Transcript_41589/m.109706 type:complete len:236 (+) Transcript_41589:142-849(+)|eukprot:CAMPEP_0115848598 /NCGR_PEP_ID=MMETSP0287-20121206/11008_1 /TAXON_ID=412157 /ORGANISM="Chrysochromulina rotalis, Strain UIO044" /LENGTH=235 /DNA_ID=CAMNT_0003302523 /DNA_START=131 /DNA_END=838 /DNA_ORIENTATION=-